MKTQKINLKRHFCVLLLSLICISTILSGCAKEQTESPDSNTAAETPSSTESNTNNSAEQTTNPNPDSAESNTDGLPSGVKVKKILKDESIKNGYHKKVELLTDGGKRKTITDPNGDIIMKYIEYEGIILKADGNKVDVQVEQGETQTLDIPDQVVIEDEDRVGLKQGVEIEWEVNTDGQIQSVELDD
ncbi:hypothetical protein [Paenibacillus sp. GCM10028914]|uniref:hypothetical protein n=1 Tax=Paenibacillus sp. GCM10028914 TaxID=3273416 RepID=UPI00361CF12E